MATVDLSGIRKLSLSERIQLVEDIWDSVAEDASELPVTHAQRDELDARIRAAEEDPDAGVRWSHIRAKLLGGE